MKIDFLRRCGSPTLELFFAGWGMDSRPFAWAADSPHTASCDFAVCYEYTDMELDGPDKASVNQANANQASVNLAMSDTRGYSEVRVRAWSLGVYAASLVLPGLGCNVSTAVAINGTLWPVDDDLGIPHAVYDATAANLSAESLERFNRRMCGAHRAIFESRKPLRSVDSLRAELLHIRECAADRSRPQFTGWTQAVLSSRDKIFPIANMRRAWPATPQLELDEPHYMPDIPFVTAE